jgi:hypothetical protein
MKGRYSEARRHTWAQVWPALWLDEGLGRQHDHGWCQHLNEVKKGVMRWWWRWGGEGGGGDGSYRAHDSDRSPLLLLHYGEHDHRSATSRNTQSVDIYIQAYRHRHTDTQTHRHTHRHNTHTHTQKEVFSTEFVLVGTQDNSQNAVRATFWTTKRMYMLCCSCAPRGLLEGKLEA